MTLNISPVSFSARKLPDIKSTNITRTDLHLDTIHVGHKTTIITNCKIFRVMKKFFLNYMCESGERNVHGTHVRDLS